MTEEQTAYQRMLDWCVAMADRPAVVEGKRTIMRLPTAEPDQRREGRIDNPGFKDMVWKGGTIGEVCDQMNQALGPVADGAYHIVE
jgi:hypothetical protein